MMLSVEVPEELFDLSGEQPAVLSPDGAALDRLADVPVGPWLAVLLDAIDVRTLTGHDLALYVDAAGRLENWAAATVNDAVGEWASRPDASWVAHEVALALHEPVQSGERRVWVARRLRRLPATLARFRRGELPFQHVVKAVEATAQVDDPDILAAVEASVWRRRVRHCATELKRAFRDALNRIDPAGASDRATKAREEQTDVTLDVGDDGMGQVTADLPVEDALVVKAAVDAYARTAKNAGDQRRIGILRAEALTRWCSDWLTGRVSLIVPGRTQPFGDRTGGDDGDTSQRRSLIVPGRTRPFGDRTGSDDATPRRPPTAGRRPVEIGIVVGLGTALGRDELPGEIPGHGIVPRDAVATLIAREQPKLRLLVADETTGRLLYRAETSYRPTAAQYAHVRAAYPFSVGPGSSVPSTRCDLDHVTEWPQGDTRIGQLAPLCRTWHNGKTRRHIKMRIDEHGVITWTTPAGQTATVEPHPYRVDPPEGDRRHATHDDVPPF